MAVQRRRPSKSGRRGAAAGLTVDITGDVDRLPVIAKALRDAGEKDLRRELVRQLRGELKPIQTRQRAQVKSLAGAPSEWKAEAAKAVRPFVRTGRRTAGVGLRTGRTDGGRRGRLLNQGRWRHPLFGDRDHWYEQKVKPGWFDIAAQVSARRLRRKVNEVLDDVARRIAKK